MFLVERVDIWAATIPDRPGALAEVLATLRDAGADLQSIIARHAPEDPGFGVVFVTPLETDHEIRAASQVGFNVTRSLHAVRVIGDNHGGLAADLTDAVAKGGINLRGFSASVIGRQFVAYLGVDSLEEAERVTALVQSRLDARPAPREFVPA